MIPDATFSDTGAAQHGDIGMHLGEKFFAHRSKGDAKSVVDGAADNDSFHAADIAEEKEQGAEKPKDPAPADTSMVKSKAADAGAWTAVSDNNFVGLTKVTIIDDNTLRMDYIHTSTGEVFDTMTLQRDHSPGKYPQA